MLNLQIKTKADNGSAKLKNGLIVNSLGQFKLKFLK